MSSQIPTISILFPFKNGAPFICEALQSITRQSFRDWELLALNHGSTDGSVDIVRRAADSRVRVIDVKGEPTLGAVLNRGWAAAAGRYLARMDADDVACPERLAEQFAFMERSPEVGVCGTWIRIMTDGVLPYTLRYPAGAQNARAFTLFAAPLSHPTVMLRRAAFESANLRYREDLPAAQDTDLWCRCADVVGMDNIPRPLLRYRVHAGSVTVGRGDVSRRCVCEAQRSLLARLIQDVSNEQAAEHARIGNGEGSTTPERLESSETWLTGLLGRNRATNVYSPGSLESAASMVWFRVCSNSSGLGIKALSAWLQSSLRGPYQPSPAEMFSFIVGAALKRNRAGYVG